MIETPILDLSGIVLERDAVTILSDVSWTIRPGEHWALLGPNGCGKTTLLKAIAGYEWPTEGSVRVLGESFGDTDIRALRRRIGWVSSSQVQRFPPEDSALRIALSGFEASVGLWRDFADVEYDAAREALDAANAGHIADRRWKVLSQGERQRTLIARAMACSPALVILDEPCAGLDPVAREEFLDDMERLAARPEAPTILLVTHHVEELRPFVSHVLLLRDGRVLASGATRAMVTSENLAALYGRPCRVDAADGRYALRMTG